MSPQSAVNRAVESFSRRGRIEGLALAFAGAQVGLAEGDGFDSEGLDWRGTPSRMALHRLVSQLRSRVARLNARAEGPLIDEGGRTDRPRVGLA
ncbi:MAG: hypothetical protein M3R38_11385 [Actinomycetota bacterium]|nr:hypothetical protein [Actinomycetota bacterium]